MESDDERVRRVNRRRARSGQVSYSDPIILHESIRRRIVLIPFYIPHSDRTELAVKLQTYRKSEPPDDWLLFEDKSLSLNETAARRLLRSLRDFFAVAEEAEDGSYLLIGITDGIADLEKHDPALVARALAKALSQREIVKHLRETELSDELVRALRGAIRLSDMRKAVEALRQHLDRGETSEQAYQEWCERHTWAFGNAYVMKDHVREISPGDILDLLLPRVISGYRDIVELKRPDMDVLRYEKSGRYYYFSAEVSKAIGQCHRYLDVLHEEAAKGLRDHPEIVAYHPRAILVIGRSSDWSADEFRALHGLNRRLSGITVMTYDQLLAQGERLLQMLSEEVESTSGDVFDEEIEDWDIEGDDLPF